MDDDLDRIRAQLDRLVMIRLITPLEPHLEAEYEQLSAMEHELMARERASSS